MDGLSVAASVAGIVSLGIQVTQSLVKFYSAYKNQKSDVAYTIQKLEKLLGVLEILHNQTADRTFSVDEQDLLKNIERSVQDCEEYIRDLQSETKKFGDQSTNTIRSVARTATYRVAFPFRQSTLQKLDENINEIVSHLSLALQILGQKDVHRVQSNVEDTRELLDLVRADQISLKICKWLNAPEATINYNEASKRKHGGTGLWLVKSASFLAWLTNPNSFLWLNGFAGCGKSVLCSTAIQSTFRHRRSNPRVGLAFFFLTFNDDTKQDCSAMLRALVLQLSTQLKDNYGLLSRLYDSYPNATPPDQALMGCLRQLIQAFDDVYIILDALDESPRDKYRSDILQALVDLRAWSEPGLHLLVTSREEPDIRGVLIDELGALRDEIIPMKNSSVDNDIASFISNSLKNDRRLRKWEKYHDQIEKALIERAKGVFRWVECQFTALRSCATSKRQLDTLLASLPRSLDKTYERILLNIGEESVQDARRILTLLCFATRPLTISEVIEGVAVELGDDPRLNIDGRLDGEDDIHQICPGLIEIDSKSGENEPTVRIAHFSVQEYLESERIHQHAVADFGVKRLQAHAELASICLTYLLGLLSPLPISEYPLTTYAANSWYKHYREGGQDFCEVKHQVICLLRSTGGQFENWVQIWDIGSRYVGTSPFYIASLLGLDSIIPELLYEEHSTSLTSRGVLNLINKQYGGSGCALEAASWGGHEKTVRLLLENGADINSPGISFFRSALNAASVGGFEKIVQLLLERGADVSASGDYHTDALYVASLNGHEKIVQLLLEKGANVNTSDDYNRNALHVASQNGHEKIVQLLLEKGADINVTDADGRTALSWAAADPKKITIFKLLLADNRIQPSLGDNLYRSSAFFAAQAGQYQILQILLVKKQIDPNCRDYYGSTLLSVAVRNFRIKSVEFLLSIHDINASVEDEFGRTPLWWALKMENSTLMKLLDKSGGVASPTIENDSSLSNEWRGPYSAYCDVCMVYLRDNFPRYNCHVCLRGGFCICPDCFEIGAHCLDISHQLIPHNMS